MTQAIHVDHNEKLARWEVIDAHGREIGHRHSRHEAVEFAIHEAQAAHAGGDDVVVCVEQPGGHYLQAWSSA